MSKWARRENEEAFKISEDSAEKMVRELLDFYEVDTTRTNQAHAEAIDEQLDELMNAYRREEVENKQDDTLGFCVIQHLKTGKTLTYRELGGKDRIAFEGYPENKSISKIHAILGKLCGYGEEAIIKLKGRDWQNARTIALVFTMASVG
jgi:hypothetical protein